MKKYDLILVLLLSLFAIDAVADYGQFTEEQICIAGIATNNGRSAKGIRVLAKQGSTISVAYTRNDGKIFGYSCQIEGEEIRWRDQSMNRWNKNIKLFYVLAENGGRLNIRSVVFGEAMSKSFTLADF